MGDRIHLTYDGPVATITNDNPAAHNAFDDAMDLELFDAFAELLLSMSYDDPEVRPLLDLEGLHEWKVGRTEGYAALERAVDESGFYGSDGAIRAADYRPR